MFKIRTQVKKINIIKTLCLCILCPILMLCQGCANNKEASVSFCAMDTIMQITCYGKNAKEAADAAQSEIVRLDELLSTGNESSEVSIINRNGGGELSSDTDELVAYALMLNKLTDGAYDMTVYPVMKLWGFTTGGYAVPDSLVLADTLRLCNSSLVDYEATDASDVSEISDAPDERNLQKQGTLKLAKGQGIDFGGLAKGYATDRLVQIFDEYDIKSAYFSLGGNVYCYHKKMDKTDWNIAIENPLTSGLYSVSKNSNSNDSADMNNSGGAGNNVADTQKSTIPTYIGALRVHDKAIVTSGGYERYFIENGEVYHHIIDTSTGYPADSGLISVTVISESGTLADGLSTACYVLGLDKSIELWKKYGSGATFGGYEIPAFDLVFMTDDGSVYATGGIARSFKSDYTYTIIDN